MGKNSLFSKTTSSRLWGPPSFLSNGLFLLVKRPGLEFIPFKFDSEEALCPFSKPATMSPLKTFCVGKFADVSKSNLWIDSSNWKIYGVP